MRRNIIHFHQLFLKKFLKLVIKILIILLIFQDYISLFTFNKLIQNLYFFGGFRKLFLKIFLLEGVD